MSIGLLSEFITFQERYLAHHKFMLLTVTAKSAHRVDAGLFGSCSVGGGGLFYYDPFSITGRAITLDFTRFF